MRWLKLVRLDTVNDYQYVSVTISYSGTYRILMESAGRTVWLLTYQNSKKWAQRTSEISDTKTMSTFHVVLRWLYTYWDISHFSRLFISKLSKILKFAAGNVHREMTKKTKYQLITVVKRLLKM